ncbi:aspartyl-phosphate phosphatase Spo0E family protein [Paenibacillus barcinonensis]|uniref:Aspartyl-phosphate phosphatase Spo0E family protein n=2 Tax=Paenibacillus barcinonensis TaxID=198119 RepID=A0A2V4VVB0_PAEBA|nr:aspartyl-phosphate phosphatase Spo0E family protein [Paenibacillus barcinonensis]PYE42795.1 Spo0E like sporulation regulatory protein [Paenibacillus barcinonensis]QKS60126.1 aspartyl-phosphate phosphatase Spo0E family protein [Paenibacillus barcinonensis]
MVRNSKTLQECIEKARQRLYHIASQYTDLQHPEVIRQSMELDELINEYNDVKRFISQSNHHS